MRVALLYREFLHDYVVNYRGNLFYEPKFGHILKDTDSVIQYLLEQYGPKRKMELQLDDYCREHHLSELEEKLKKTKIKIV